MKDTCSTLIPRPQKARHTNKSLCLFESTARNAYKHRANTREAREERNKYKNKEESFKRERESFKRERELQERERELQERESFKREKRGFRHDTMQEYLYHEPVAVALLGLQLVLSPISFVSIFFF